MVDVFEEVEEEMRWTRLRAFARRYLPWAIAGLLVGVIVAGGIYGWRTYQRSGAEAASLAYSDGLELLGKNDRKGAEAKFAQVAEGRSAAYKSLALVQLGGLQLAAGDAVAAAKRFDEAAKVSTDPLYSDAARLKAVLLRMDTQPPAATLEQLEPIAGEDRPYRLLAVEARAIAHAAAGQTQEARADAAFLAIAPQTPPGMRARAQALQALIDSGGARSLAAVAKAAAALPAAPPPPVGGPVLPGVQ